MFNSKILLSVASIAAAGALIIGATFAFFSDTETSRDNTITAGTIDISVDGQNPWTKQYSDKLADMKPGMVREVNYPVKNVGANPVVVWKQIHVTGTGTGIETEPECTDQGGAWDDSSNACDWDGNGPTIVDINDLDNVTTYDMKVGDTVLIDDAWNVTMGDINSVWVPLGRIEKGESITVTQSYHLLASAGNEYQGDTITFDINIYAEQIGGTGPGPTTGGLVLENKDGDWNPIIDGRWGLLTFNASGSTFDYDLIAKELDASTSYSLIYYADPWAGNHPGALLGTGTSDGDGNLVMTGNPDPGDMPNPADANYLGGAKIWLVKTSDYNGSNAMTAWHMDQYLFESNLIKYDDTDTP